MPTGRPCHFALREIIEGPIAVRLSCVAMNGKIYLSVKPSPQPHPVPVGADLTKNRLHVSSHPIPHRLIENCVRDIASGFIAFVFVAKLIAESRARQSENPARRILESQVQLQSISQRAICLDLFLQPFGFLDIVAPFLRLEPVPRNGDHRDIPARCGALFGPVHCTFAGHRKDLARISALPLTRHRAQPARKGTAPDFMVYPLFRVRSTAASVRIGSVRKF